MACGYKCVIDGKRLTTDNKKNKTNALCSDTAGKLLLQNPKQSGETENQQKNSVSFNLRGSSSDRCGLYVEETYRVSSSESCVWSGGKNFTTKRRMVFLGPDGGKTRGYG